MKSNSPSVCDRFGPGLMTALVALAFCMASEVRAAVIVAWDFNGLPGGTNNFGPSPFAVTTQDSSVTSVGLTRGSGVTTSATGATNGWGGNGFASIDLASAISVGDFVTFAISPTSGNAISFENIAAYNIRRSDAGPTTGQWQYQIGSGSFVNIGSAITWGSNTVAAGNAQGAIDLTGITALQNVTETVTFRIVNWGVGGTGNWYLNNFGTAVSGYDLALNGTVNPFSVIPEPSLFALSGLGLTAVMLRRRRPMA